MDYRRNFVYFDNGLSVIQTANTIKGQVINGSSGAPAHPFSGSQLPLGLTVSLKEKATDLSAVLPLDYWPDNK